MLSRIEVGDAVRVRGAEGHMTVEEDLGDGRVRCVWFDVRGAEVERASDVFAKHDLELVD